MNRSNNPPTFSSRHDTTRRRHQAHLIASLSLLVPLGACALDSDPSEDGDPGLDSRAAEVEEHVLQLSVIDDSARASNSEEGLTNHEELNAILESHGVDRYHEAYPYSQLPQLLDVQQLRCLGCEPEALLEELESTGLVTEIRLLGAPVELNLGNPGGYDPEDNFWQTHAQDWLWHLVITDSDLAWNMTQGDPDVLIAVVDAGFETTHPELASKMSAIDPSTGYPLGTHYHGTATAAMAAGETALVGQIAVGDAPSVGFNVDVQGFMWGGTSAAHYAAMAMDADVVSISWFSYCSPSASNTDLLAIQEILDHGTTIVAAAGNGNQHCNGQDVFPFSAIYDDRIIVVTSTTSYDTHETTGGASHSHYANVDLAAPGRSVHISTTGGGYTTGWGTSFSTPMVAGAVGLMKSVNTCLLPEDVQEILKNSTDVIADAANFPGQVGTGRLNVNRAVAVSQSTDYACPQGGWYDGANCYLGSPPAGTTPFIYANNYYYTPLPGNLCPYPGSWYDGANCYVQPVPDDVTPFVWGGNWYYSSCANDGWTEWTSRDLPSGSGDWELRNLINGVCANPQAIQCRATDGTYFTQTGDVDVVCEPATGLICKNADQADSTCEDYEVRFFCP